MTLAVDGGTSTVWTIYSHNFVADSQQTSIKFSGSGDSNGLGGQLDDVSLKIVDDSLLYLVEYCFEPLETCSLCQSAGNVKPQCDQAATVAEECMECYGGIENGAFMGGKTA